MKSHFQRLGVIALVPFALFLNSCSRDLSLEKFGKMTSSLEQASSNIADDIYNSCINRTKYISFLAAPNTPGSFSLREQEEKNCEVYNKSAANSVQNANTLLLDYLKALVNLANGDEATTNQNFTAFGESIKKLKLPQSNGKSFSFKASEVDAVTGIAKFITNASTREFRRSQLKQAFICTDKDVQTYIRGAAANQPATGGLIALTEQAYLDGILKAEEQQIRTYFTDYITKLASVTNNQIIDYLKLEEDYNKAMESLRNRKVAAQKYVEILQNIAKMHTQLKIELQGKGEDKLSDAQLQDYCQNIHTTTAQKSVTKEKAVNYDAEQIKRVEKIVSKYANNLDTLIQQIEQTH